MLIKVSSLAVLQIGVLNECRRLCVGGSFSSCLPDVSFAYLLRDEDRNEYNRHKPNNRGADDGCQNGRWDGFDLGGGTGSTQQQAFNKKKSAD